MPRRQRLLGKGQIAVCQRSGIKCHASELVRDGRLTSLLVLPEWADEAHPQERPYVPVDEEGTPRFPVSPDQTPTIEPVLTAEATEFGTIELTWTAAERVAGPRIEEYDIYRDSGDGLTLIDTVFVEYDAYGGIVGPGLEYEDTDVVEGATYSYQVIALTSNNLGLASNTVTVEPTPAVTGFLLQQDDGHILTEDGGSLLW